MSMSSLFGSTDQRSAVFGTFADMKSKDNLGIFGKMPESKKEDYSIFESLPQPQKKEQPKLLNKKNQQLPIYDLFEIRLKTLQDKLIKSEQKYQVLKNEFEIYKKNNPSKEQYQSLKKQIESLTEQKSNEPSSENFENKQLAFYLKSAILDVKKMSNSKENQLIQILQKQSLLIQKQTTKIQSLETEISSLNLSLKNQQLNINNPKTCLPQTNHLASLGSMNYNSNLFQPQPQNKSLFGNSTNQYSNTRRGLFPTDNSFYKKDHNPLYRSQIDQKSSGYGSIKQYFEDGYKIIYQPKMSVFNQTLYNVQVSNRFGKVQILKGIPQPKFKSKRISQILKINENSCEILDPEWQKIPMRLTTYNFMQSRSMSSQAKKRLEESIKFEAQKNGLIFEKLDGFTGDLSLLTCKPDMF